MAAHLWPPEDPDELDPAVTALPTGSRLFRVHPTRFAANEFNPGKGRGARFHIFAREDGQQVPSLYAAGSIEAAVTEAIFHDVPVRPRYDRRVGMHKLTDRRLSELRTLREILLVELHHPGLGRLGLEPSEITSTSPSAYPRTREWARVLHARTSSHGLVWMSRLLNSQKAYFFFGDRVSNSDLESVDDGLPLWRGPGLQLVHEIAETNGITVVHG